MLIGNAKIVLSLTTVRDPSHVPRYSFTPKPIKSFSHILGIGSIAFLLKRCLNSVSIVSDGSNRSSGNRIAVQYSVNSVYQCC